MLRFWQFQIAPIHCNPNPQRNPENYFNKAERAKTLGELNMGVANSIHAIRIKHSVTVELQENLANRICELKKKNIAICDMEH